MVEPIAHRLQFFYNAEWLYFDSDSSYSQTSRAIWLPIKEAVIEFRDFLRPYQTCQSFILPLTQY